MRHASIITHPSGLFRDPFSLDRFFETALGDRSFPRESAPEWRPAVDVERGEKTLAIRADLPGVDPENIKIAYENGVLTLSGERNDERKAEEEHGARWTERFTGAFSRSIELPEDVDGEAIQARYERGVLEIECALKPESLPRRIPISVN